LENVVFNLQNIIEQFHNSIPFPLDIVRVEENLDNEVMLDDSQDEREELSKADGRLASFECREGDMVQELVLTALSLKARPRKDRSGGGTQSKTHGLMLPHIGLVWSGHDVFSVKNHRIQRNCNLQTLSCSNF